MKKITLFLITIVFFSCKNAKEQFTVTNGILIENSTIISSDNNGTVKSYTGYVVTDNSKIIYAGKNKPIVKGNYKTINGKGKFVIPGLIDSHVHLNNIAGINFRQRKANKALVNDYFKRLPKNFLYYGYTTLIDVDNYAPNVMNRLKTVKVRPEIYTCGKKLQIMDDFTMVMGEIPKNKRYKTPFLHDKYNTTISYPDSLHLEEHSVSNIVSSIKNEGNICVKTLYEDASSGFPQIWELPSKQIIKDVVTEAHKENLKVIMHATSFEGQQFATNAGVDVIAHAMWNWTANSKDYLNTNLPETHKQLLIDIAKKQIGYQPTIRAIFAEKDILDNTFKNDEVLQKLYTSNYINWLQSEGSQWSRNKILARPKFIQKINPELYTTVRAHFNSDAEMTEKIYGLMDVKIKKVLKTLSDNNANLLFSTDNGAMNMYTNPPGYNGYLEMQYWADAKIPLEQIFKAATYNNAKTFNLLDDIGTIEIGKTANILILDKNPLETIDAYNSIEYLIMNGVFIKREALSVKTNNE